MPSNIMHHCFLRGYVFRAQTQEIKERGGNQSTGIDFFITQERVIFLDTQARKTHCRDVHAPLKKVCNYSCVLPTAYTQSVYS